MSRTFFDGLDTYLVFFLMLVFELILLISCADDVRAIVDPDSNAESQFVSMRFSRAAFCLALAKAGHRSPQDIVLRIVCDSLNSESPAAALLHDHVFIFDPSRAFCIDVPWVFFDNRQPRFIVSRGLRRSSRLLKAQEIHDEHLKDIRPFSF